MYAEGLQTDVERLTYVLLEETLQVTLTPSAYFREMMELEVTVPVNTTAEIVVLGARVESLLESSVSVNQVDGISAITQLETGVSLRAGSGDYQFNW